MPGSGLFLPREEQSELQVLSQGCSVAPGLVWGRTCCGDASQHLWPKGERRRRAGWPHAVEDSPARPTPGPMAPHGPCPTPAKLSSTGLYIPKWGKEREGRTQGRKQPIPSSPQHTFPLPSSWEGLGWMEGLSPCQVLELQLLVLFSSKEAAPWHTVMHEAHRLPRATSTPFTVSVWICR